MKAITILQPWATLIMTGQKRIETRSWATKYRGEILIHAGVSTRHVYKPLISLFPCGSIIGKATIEDVVSTDVLMGRIYKSLPRPTIHLINSGEDFFVSEVEEGAGDYSPGRYGWLLSQVLLLKKPIPWKGQLSLWNFPDEKLEGVKWVNNF